MVAAACWWRPLRYDGEVYGVVYLENRERVDSFTPESRAFLADKKCQGLR